MEIPGSNIIDIVNDLVRTRKTFSAIGGETFAQTLNEIGVPREYIGNSDLLKAMNKASKDTFNKSKNDTTLKNNSSFSNFHSFAEGTTSVSTPKSSRKKKKNQSGFGWHALGI